MGRAFRAIAGVLRSSYLRRRVISSIVAVFGVSVLVFLLVHLIPGDPIDNLLGERADPIDKTEMRRCMDLDQPLTVQFGRFLQHIADGTLGRTCPDRRRPVASRIGEALSSTAVVLRHALRNALVPVITVAGIQFGSLLAGAVVTEKVFARPGIGTLLLEAISQRDYRVVQGCTLVIAVSYVTVNLLVDL